MRQVASLFTEPAVLPNLFPSTVTFGPAKFFAYTRLPPTAVYVTSYIFKRYSRFKNRARVYIQTGTRYNKTGAAVSYHTTTLTIQKCLSSICRLIPPTRSPLVHPMKKHDDCERCYSRLRPRRLRFTNMKTPTEISIPYHRLPKNSAEKEPTTSWNARCVSWIWPWTKTA